MGAPEPTLPESLFDGRYRIVRVLGAGGFGQVFLAEDLRLGRDVAIKELLADRQHDRATYDRYLERFQREARAGSSLRSQNVVTVYDLHVDADGNYYLVLEYVDGQDLSDLLAQVGVLPLERALAITLDIARALDQVHEQDIVHRDIKPANILITVRGLAKLSDFGLAQVAHESQRSQLASRHPGTPVYMSPEQRVGYGYIDGRSDLYSLGLVLYEMLTGRRYGESGQPIVRARPDLPPAVIAMIDKLLQEDRDDRYQSARALIHDLSRIAEQPDIPVAALPSSQAAARPPTVPSPVSPPPPVLMPPASGPPAFAPPASPAITPSFPAAPAPARRSGGQIGLIIAAAACILVVVAASVLVLGNARSRHASSNTAHVPPTPAIAPTALPTAPAPTPAAPTAPEVGAATPTVISSPASGGASAAVTATSNVVPSGPGSDPRLTAAPAPTSDPARRASSVETNVPSSDVNGAGATWDDPGNLLEIKIAPGWRQVNDPTMPERILEGPDGTSLFLVVFSPQQGTVMDEILIQRQTFDSDPKVRYTYPEVPFDPHIGNEQALSFRFGYSLKDAADTRERSGQIWVINHGGKEFLFIAYAIGSARPALEAIVGSVMFH
jgi:serine/threonine-protein kinase